MTTIKKATARENRAWLFVEAYRLLSLIVPVELNDSIPLWCFRPEIF
jgi:hypothetical protein